jgi:hypothetical protein
MLPLRTALLTSAAFVTVLWAPEPIRAQEPAPPADRSALRGMVMDEEGMPVVNAEVVVLGRREITRTDAAGRFRLENHPPGLYDVMIRRLGFVSANFEWPARGGVRVDISVIMRPLPVSLDPVVISERETKGLTGTSTITGFVVDTAGRRVGDVEVQLVGSGRRTVTGHDGSFVFRRVNAGDYSVASRRMGYSPVTRAVHLTEKEERELMLVMHQLPQMLDAVEIRERSGFGASADALRELDLRLRWFGGSNSAVILGPEVMAQYNRISLGTLIDFRGRLALQQLERMRATRGATSIGGSLAGPAPRERGGPEADDCILIDGVKFVEQPIGSFSSDQVDRVEYYPRGSELTGTLASRMRSDRCGPQLGSHPPYYVVWLKQSRR